MSLTEDLGVFFKADEFADTATLDGQTVRGLVDAGFENATLDGWGGGGSSPRFTLPTASVPADVEGKPLVITSGFATIAGTVMAAFITFGVSPAHLLSARYQDH